MAKLKFNCKIYPPDAVKKAISAYTHLAKFKTCLNGNYIEVIITNGALGSNNLLVNEFANYVLGMAKK